LFGDVEIREFPSILGDNPFCEGAPLQLAWKPIHKQIMQLDLYEYAKHRVQNATQRHHTNHKKKAKKRSNWHMTDVERELYLLSKGYNLSEIVESVQQGERIRQQRYNSFHGKKWDRFRVVVESAKERFVPNQKNLVSAKTA